ncbi:hypothetical protein GPA10_22485 [Streptomyces sp. p1417]|uniref:Uncharacterized protein n=1 Tax=Streptomyces typhae TaxID=2681492 RepID=A0A6L6X0Z3_9ACTN|nr:hypothetical protein [Streptomyces typhae]MVO87454.1 hypothetical protein [Streptomyces typhae]
MSSKFQSDEAEELYHLQPDQEAGDSSEGPAWFGLYQLEAAILTEDSRGVVWMRKYSNSAELNEAWELIIQNTYPVEEAT